MLSAGLVDFPVSRGLLQGIIIVEGEGGVMPPPRPIRGDDDDDDQMHACGNVWRALPPFLGRVSFCGHEEGLESHCSLLF